MATSDPTPSFEDLCVIFNYKPKGIPLINEEAAAILRMKPSALDFMRFSGNGPRYSRPHGQRRVLYSERDVLFYLWQGMRTSTSEQPNAAHAV